MKRTKIPWADFSINPIKGLCPMACPYCYARRMYKRFKWDAVIRFDQTAFFPTFNIPRGSRVFVGSTMELFGSWIDGIWLSSVFSVCNQRDDVNWIFLTKQPQNLAQWSPFPENCWIGVSVTTNDDMTRAMVGLSKVKAPVRFLSFEPLLGRIALDEHISMKGVIDWIIIGSQTQPVKHPRWQWVDEITFAAENADIPIFIKEPLASHLEKCRQEFPKVAGK